MSDDDDSWEPEIAELRRQAQARQAELKILHEKNMQDAAGDAEARRRLTELQATRVQ